MGTRAIYGTINQRNCSTSCAKCVLCRSGSLRRVSCCRATAFGGVEFALASQFTPNIPNSFHTGGCVSVCVCVTPPDRKDEDDDDDDGGGMIYQPLTAAGYCLIQQQQQHPLAYMESVRQEREEVRTLFGTNCHHAAFPLAVFASSRAIAILDALIN